MVTSIPKQTGDYYTVAELAERYKVTHLTVRRWMYNGLIKAFKVGGILRFSGDEVERFDRANQIQYVVDGEEVAS